MNRATHAGFCTFDERNAGGRFQTVAELKRFQHVLTHTRAIVDSGGGGNDRSNSSKGRAIRWWRVAIGWWSTDGILYVCVLVWKATKSRARAPRESTTCATP